MSRHSEIEASIESKLQNFIEGYSYYTEWYKEGFSAANGVQITVTFTPVARSSDSYISPFYSAVVYIYREYSNFGDNRAVTKEQLRLDLEAISQSSDLNFSGSEVPILEDNNRGNPCWYFELELNNFT